MEKVELSPTFCEHLIVWTKFLGASAAILLPVIKQWIQSEAFAKSTPSKKKEKKVSQS